MNSFQAKIGWKRMGRRENKKLQFCFVSTRRVIENFKKIEKLKNTIMTSFQAKIDWKMLRKGEIKIIVPFSSYPTLNRKFQKNSK